MHSVWYWYSVVLLSVNKNSNEKKSGSDGINMKEQYTL